MYAITVLLFLSLSRASNVPLNTTFYNISTVGNTPQSLFLNTMDRLTREQLIKADLKKPTFLDLEVVVANFGKQNCLLIIDNHKGVDLPSLHHPVILRQIQPAIIWNSENNPWMRNGIHTLWIHSGLLHSNQTITGEGSRINCIKNNTSIFYRQQVEFHRYYPFHTTVCIDLDIFRFSLNTKPWNCQTQIQLYPHLPFVSAATNIFHYDVSTNPSLFKRLSPSTVPNVHMIINTRRIKDNKPLSWLEKHFGNHDKELQALLKWMRSTLILDESKQQNNPALKTHLFIIGYVKERPNGLKHLHDKLQSFYYLEVCGNCGSQSPFKDPAIVKYPFNINLISDLIFGKTKIKQKTNTFWDIEQIEYNDKNDRIFSGIINHLRLCQNYFTGSLKSSSRKTSLVNTNFRTPHERLFHAVAHLIQWSMDNYTYQISRSYRCVNGRTSRSKELRNLPPGFQISMLIKGDPSKLSIYQMLSLPETITQLRYVSCGGYRGKRFISFWQLLKIYDNYAWLCIIISSVSFALFIGTFSKQQLIRKHKRSRLYILKVLKILLQQVDPFFHKAITTDTLRCAVGSFLLVGVVLSNAYKSEKVYKLMTMGKPIPYERFQELLENNFTILTRSGYIYYDYLSLVFSTRPKNNGPLQTLTKVSPHHLTHRKKYPHMLTLTSEIFEWDKASTYNGENSQTLAFMLNHTKLHPSIENILVEKVKTNNLEIHYNNRSIHFEDDMRNNVWQSENTALVDFLSKCNKTAIVAPDFVVNELGRKLISNGTSDVYVGKESYSSISTSIIFSGWITPSVLKRLWRIKESGLWDWWPKFIRNSKVFNEEVNSNKKGLEKPSMSGNIFMLFVMMLYGGMASGILFIWETYTLLVRYLKKQNVYSKNI